MSLTFFINTLYVNFYIMIKKFKEFINENLDIQNSNYVLGMPIEQQEELLRKYVEKYYNEFPDDLENAKEDGSSCLNWGEFESGSDEDVVANCVCDILAAHDMEDRPMSEEEESLVELAWRIADEYVNQN